MAGCSARLRLLQHLRRFGSIMPVFSGVRMNSRPAPGLADQRDAAAMLGAMSRAALSWTQAT